MAEVEGLINAYFKDCTEKSIPLTISGLALALDTNRQTILNYQHNYEEEYFDTIKKAKAICENYAEVALYDRSLNVAGVIFNLKNNYGWRDKQEHEHTGDVSMRIVHEYVKPKKRGRGKAD